MAQRRRARGRKSRSRRNKYLGTRVPDIGKPGLDTLTEVKGIVKAIIEDVKNHRIAYKKGMSRMNFLSLIVSRSNDFYGRKERRAQEIINDGRRRLKRLNRRIRLRRVAPKFFL